MLSVMTYVPDAKTLEPEIQNYRKSAEAIARQIRGWTQSLQDSPIKGQKFLTQESKEEYQGQKSRQAFLEQLEEMAKQSRGF